MRATTKLVEALIEATPWGGGGFPSRPLHDMDGIGGKYVLLVVWSDGKKAGHVFDGSDLMNHAGGNARAGNARSIGYSKRLLKGETVASFKAKLKGTKYDGMEVFA